MTDISALPHQDIHEFDVNNVWTIASVVFASGVALLALYMGPVLVGEYISKLGVSESRAGMIMSMEMTGFTLGAAVLFVIAGKNWRRIVIAALLVMIIANALLLFVDSLTMFVACRFIAGIGAGLVATMTIQVIGLMRDPDRVYGLWTVGQLSLGALGMIVFPSLIASAGINTVFLVWALLAAILLATVRFYPSGRSTVDSSGNSSGINRRLVLGLLCLLGLFVYYSGQAGVWFYLERVGLSWGLEQNAVGHTLFLSLLAGIAGATMAIMLGNRLGRAVPLSLSLISSAVSIGFLIQPGSATLFVVVACLFNFGWYMFLPYISSIIAVTDDNGRLLAGLAVTFPAGLSAGPAIAAWLISDAETLLPCLVFGLVSVPLGLAMMLPAARIKAVTNQ